MTKSRKAPLGHTRNGAPVYGARHTHTGNCWDALNQPDYDVCMLHEQPRGNCDACIQCPLCDAEYE